MKLKKKSGCERAVRVRLIWRNEVRIRLSTTSDNDGGDALKVRGPARVSAKTVPLELTLENVQN